MFQKSLAAVMLTLLAVTAAHAEPSPAKKAGKVIEARDKTAKIWLDLTQDKDVMKSDFKGMAAAIGKIFSNVKDGDAGDDDDDDDDDDVAATGEPCVSTADGKAGANNSSPDTGNGGAGGTVELKGKPAAGDCYSANGGDGGSNNYSSGKDNSVTGNGGKGGKIISR